MVHAIGRAVAVGVFLLLVSACGGEEGGSTLEVTPTSLTFTATQGGPLPAPQSIHVHQNPELAYGTTFGEGAYWLDETTFAMIDHSLPEFDHVFAVTTTDLEPGTYTTTFVIRISEPGEYVPPGPYIPGPLVEQKTIDFTYIVTAP